MSDSNSQDPILDSAPLLPDFDQISTRESESELVSGDASPEQNSLSFEPEPTQLDAVVETAGFAETVLVEAKSFRKKPSTDPTFSELSLSQQVQQAVQQAGYEHPTEIQTKIIPLMLDGRDLLAQSQTGTGKTAAFALPILSRIKPGQRKPQVLVLTPTRELAIQVAKSFSTYGACLSRFNVVAIYGGQDYDAQFKQLRRGVEVVVGTPGRVIDHIKRGTLDLSAIECLVLDEADEMLNMGFLEDVQFVLEQTPDQRQIALFSATIPGPIRTIAQTYLKDPVKITIKTKTMTADSIRQRAVFVAHRDKIDVLARFLEVEETDGVIVFTRTKDATITVAEQLSRKGLSVSAINGDMPQKTRERTIEQLKAGRLNILVATDVAARGLDVTRISHVFNFDLPEGSESYIHRVGRTGRAGRKGEAIIFLTKTQRSKLRLIEKATKQPIEIVQPPSVDDMNAMRIKQFKQRITAVTAEQDLTIFKEMIAAYAEETGKPMLMIAAALAQIGQRGESFLMKNQPRRAFEHDAGRGGKKGRDRFDRNSSDRSRRNGKRNDRELGPPEAGLSRYRIDVGRHDGVRPGNIVGAIANEAGIAGNQIGPIKIHGSFSTIDLPQSMAKETFETLQITRVAGKPLRLRLASKEHDESRPRRKRRCPPNDELRSPKKNNSRRFTRGKVFNGGKRKKPKARA